MEGSQRHAYWFAFLSRDQMRLGLGKGREEGRMEKQIRECACCGSGREPAGARRLKGLDPLAGSCWFLLDVRTPRQRSFTLAATAGLQLLLRSPPSCHGRPLPPASLCRRALRPRSWGPHPQAKFNCSSLAFVPQALGKEAASFGFTFGMS